VPFSGRLPFLSDCREGQQLIFNFVLSHARVWFVSFASTGELYCLTCGMSICHYGIIEKISESRVFALRLSNEATSVRSDRGLPVLRFCGPCLSGTAAVTRLSDCFRLTSDAHFEILDFRRVLK
jgi:hypothetical protein